MKLIAPDYYGRFRCFAGQCRHSCCIGWEIDIDEETLGLYRSAEGVFGRRLAENISTGETACFRLGENERCPFLNGDNLCDIIINMGEDALCSICADHPRFRNYFDSRTEIGLGLCCEAAAELILGNPDPVKLITLEDDGADSAEETEAHFLDLRDSVIGLLQNRSMSVDKRIEAVMSGFKVPAIGGSAAHWARVYSRLERLDEGWGERLEKLAAADVGGHSLSDTVREQLLVYFVYRHLADGIYDGTIGERIAFCILSERMIDGLCSACSESVNEIARMYSAEIEYSDENVEALIDALRAQSR